MIKSLFVALLLVTTLSTQTIKNTESNHQPKKVSILPTLTQPVYAAKEEMKPIVTTPPPKPVIAPVAQPQNTSAGNCEAWFAQAGITDLVNARILLSKENASCDPQRWNMAGSSACGIAQELPCGKSGCGIPPNADGLCQIKWQKTYVEQRYGSYARAVAFHNLNRWY